MPFFIRSTFSSFVIATNAPLVPSIFAAFRPAIFRIHQGTEGSIR